MATPGGRVVGFLNERAGRRLARTRAARHRDSSHCHEQRARDLEISRRAVLWIERPPRRPPRLRRALRRHSASRALVPPRTEHALDGGRAAGVFRAAVRPSPARRAPGIAAPRPGSSPPRLAVAVAVASRGGGSPARRPPPSRRRVRARRSPPRATRRPPRRPSLRARLANRRGARDRGGGRAALGCCLGARRRRLLRSRRLLPPRRLAPRVHPRRRRRRLLLLAPRGDVPPRPPRLGVVRSERPAARPRGPARPRRRRRLRRGGVPRDAPLGRRATRRPDSTRRRRPRVAQERRPRRPGAHAHVLRLPANAPAGGPIRKRRRRNERRERFSEQTRRGFFLPRWRSIERRRLPPRTVVGREPIIVRDESFAEQP